MKMNSCPKCGGTCSHRYHAEKQCFQVPNLYTRNSYEHLHYFCDECGYDFVGPVKGKKLTPGGFEPKED